MTELDNAIKIPEFPDEYMEYCIRTYSRQILSYCYRMLHNKQEAEDTVQEVFLKAYSHICYNKQPIRSIQLWLYKVAYNRCINILRRQKYISFISLNENIVTDEYIPGDYLEASEFSEQIQGALKKLSHIQRTVLLLRTINGFDYKEISLVVNRNPQTVRKQYERAKKKVRKFLDIEKGGNQSEKYFIV